MVFGRFLLLLPNRSRLESFFSEKKASELASSKGWTVFEREHQQLGLSLGCLTRPGTERILGFFLMKRLACTCLSANRSPRAS